MKIMFVCYGNICRSTMAEYIFKFIDKDNKFIVKSSGISNEEYGNDIYYKAKDVLNKNNIPFNKHCAHKITFDEFNEFDLIIVCEDYMIKSLSNMFGSSDKIKMLCDFDIEDPWYSNNFDKVFLEIKNGCFNLYNSLID